MKILPTDFEGQSIRRVYDEDTETWWFSVIDVVQVLTQQVDYQTARKYWNKLKERLTKEGSESVTNCHRLKLPAADGKNYLTDVATVETLLRLVQSVPSPKAEPIKLWLAKVGYERMQELADPVLSLDRARQTWQQHGRSRVDFYRPGRTFYPADCRKSRCHGHDRKQIRSQSGRADCPANPPALGEPNGEIGSDGRKLLVK